NLIFFISSRRRHTRCYRDWSSDVCSSDLLIGRGNFGEVWKAEAPGGIDVAVKIVNQPLDNDAAKREMQSLELIKKLRHATLLSRSEERRVGKECRFLGALEN